MKRLFKHFLIVARNCFQQFNVQQQGEHLLAASFSMNFLLDIEPRLSNDLGRHDILELEVLTDQQGKKGDVRDILILRALQKCEVSISAKNNHRAVKHSRLFSDTDFGDKWLNIPCSEICFSEVRQIFEPLRKIKQESRSTKTWSTIENKEESIYLPVLNAFKKELTRIYEISPRIVARQLVEYLVGCQDFYKVIKGDQSVEIQAYNLHGTLNQPF